MRKIIFLFKFVFRKNKFKYFFLFDVFDFLKTKFENRGKNGK